MLGLLIADGEEPGPAAGGGLEGPGKGGSPDQGADAGGVCALHPHRVEPQACRQGQGPALEFPQQQQALLLAPGHPHPQAPGHSQGAPHLEAQQQAAALGLRLERGQVWLPLGWGPGRSSAHGW